MTQQVQTTSRDEAMRWIQREIFAGEEAVVCAQSMHHHAENIARWVRGLQASAVEALTGGRAVGGAPRAAFESANRYSLLRAIRRAAISMLVLLEAPANQAASPSYSLKTCFTLRMQNTEMGILLRKNTSYASTDDAFANLRDGGELGVLIRMGDKCARIANLLAGGAELYDDGEALTDALHDLRNYAALLWCWCALELDPFYDNAPVVREAE